MNKYVIFDANNIASLAFNRAKSIMMKEIHNKINTENEEELLEEARNNIKGFSSHLFFNKIHSIMRLYKNSKMLFVWDGRHGSVWRKNANSDYKANRSHDGDEMYPIFIDMMNMVKEILEFYPVLQFSKFEAEADDLIYSIVKHLNGNDVEVISTDTDMIQLSQQFDNVKIWNPIKKKHHDIPPYEYVLFKSIVGDKSDNIKGLPRFGPKKAQKAIEEGIEILSKEHQDIILSNLEIIDLSKNPSQEENYEYVKNIIENEISYDLDQIKRMFFDLKLKNQMDKFGSTAKLLKNIV